MNLFLLMLLAASLPTFEDFRRVDRMRRLTGQLQTAELLSVSQIDADLIKRTAQAHADDAAMQWGAAELLPDWTPKREFFDAALRLNGTNTATMLRMACCAAKAGQFAAALSWLHECEDKDKDNMAPWLAELWILNQQKQPLHAAKPPESWTLHFRDYSVEASHARIKLLEAAGYSAYSARRLGFSADSVAISMARDLAKPPFDDEELPILKTSAKALQTSPPFLLDELVGQTLERMVLASRADADTSVEVRFRVVEMDERRDAIKQLLADMERTTVDFATEQEMVRYFDNVLDLGEEAAMKHLAETVRGKAKP